MAVVRPCAATFIELVKKVSFSNEFQTLVEHSLHTGEIVGQDDSYYITGHNLVVDGGLTLR